MKLLRVVITYNAALDTDIGRQTNFIKESDFENGDIIIPRGKEVKSISIKMVDSEQQEDEIKKTGIN